MRDNQSNYYEVATFTFGEVNVEFLFNLQCLLSYRNQSEYPYFMVFSREAPSEKKLEESLGLVGTHSWLSIELKTTRTFIILPH
jgi:hypothetical protein